MLQMLKKRRQIATVMRLQNFIQELRDNDPTWEELFEKYDCVFLANEEEFPEIYERFKQELANTLFELRYGRRHLWEQIDAYYQIRLQEHSIECADVLKSFLEIPDRPKYSTESKRFLKALKKYAAARKDCLEISVTEFIKLTSELLRLLSAEIRESFVRLEDRPKEFAQMTSQVGEILASLVFSQLRDCGLFTQAKLDLDNPNMPRHGEDLLAFFFREDGDGTDDELFLVEAKSSKDSISRPIREIRDRFDGHIRKLPGYEIARLKRVIEERIGPKCAEVPRRRISQLVWRARLNPENAQLKFGAFLHYRHGYRPRASTLSPLGEINVDPCRLHVIVFQFVDFERTVREVFERAWTV
jgi:hypothetical protein